MDTIIAAIIGVLPGTIGVIVTWWVLRRRSRRERRVLSLPTPEQTKRIWEEKRRYERTHEELVRRALQFEKQLALAAKKNLENVLPETGEKEQAGKSSAAFLPVALFGLAGLLAWLEVFLPVIIAICIPVGVWAAIVTYRAEARRAAARAQALQEAKRKALEEQQRVLCRMFPSRYHDWLQSGYAITKLMELGLTKVQAFFVLLAFAQEYPKLDTAQVQTVALKAMERFVSAKGIP